MRGRAQKKYGIKMNEYGLFQNDTELIKCADEAAIFAYLGLAYIPPELRENLGEIEAAENGTLPRLITESDLKGIIHAHTVASDGVNTLREMVEETKRLGFSYLGITEHSQSAAGYAHGLKEERLAETWRKLRISIKNLMILKYSKASSRTLKRTAAWTTRQKY